MRRRCCCGKTVEYKLLVAGCYRRASGANTSALKGALVEIFADSGLTDLVFSAYTPAFLDLTYQGYVYPNLIVGKAYWIRITPPSARYKTKTVAHTATDPPSISSIQLDPANGFHCAGNLGDCDQDHQVPLADTLYYSDSLGASITLGHNGTLWVGEYSANLPSGACGGMCAAATVPMRVSFGSLTLGGISLSYPVKNAVACAGTPEVGRVTGPGIVSPSVSCPPALSATTTVTLYQRCFPDGDFEWLGVTGTITE